MIELQCRWLWVSRRRERKKGGKNAGRESKRSRYKTAERHQLLWNNETFTSHWTVGHLRGILVVSTTLVQMSHAEAFVSQWGWSSFSDHLSEVLRSEFWGVSVYMSPEGEWIGNSVSKRFLRSIFPHIQHILHRFHKHSMQNPTERTSGIQYILLQ